MMRCVIEGWPDDGAIDEALYAALSGLVARETTGWDSPPKVVTRSACFRVEASVVDWPQLARCVVLAMRMGATRAMWLWHISDDADCITAELAVSTLVVWRGMLCSLSGPPEDWSPGAVSRDAARDQALREQLAAVAAQSMKAMGIRGAPVAPAPSTPALRLFEFVPAEDWQRTTQPAAIGRSMIQIDGRSGGVHSIKGRVEVCNTGERPLDAARVLVSLRGPRGALLGTISADSQELPPGSIRVITLSAEQVLGRLPVLTIDLSCQAMERISASFSAHVLEV